MITKERLEELIEQGATIWVCCWGKFKELNLSDLEYMDIEDNEICYEDTFGICRTTDLNHLFETKEDAEEYAEFGNITRTERLELPSWASIEKDFDKFTNGSYVLAERDEFSLELKISKPLISQIVIYTEDDYYNWNLSRENYNEARRLCVKLFKGESDG